MRLRRRIKKSTKQYIMVAFICIVVIGSAAALTSFTMVEQIRVEYREKLASAHHELSVNQQNVYIAIEDIKAGDIITKKLIKQKSVYSSQPKSICISQKDIGKTALIDIPVGTQLLRSMLTVDSLGDELRETEYQVIQINANIKENDTVDVRICYPNGESYVVLSKKVLRGYVAETATCYFWTSEEEILRMSAAIVDANLYEGAKLLTTKYIEPGIQRASFITYTPNIQVLALIESDPNIVEKCSQELNKTVRKSLENRLVDSMATDISKIDWDVSDYEFEVGQNKGENVTQEPKESKNPKVSKETEESSELGSSESNSENAELGSAQESYMYFAKESETEYGE